MICNPYQNHLLILSEDNAYKDMANGFAGHFAVDGDKINIVKPAGGVQKLLALFLQTYAAGLLKYQNRHVLLLFDLDGNPNHHLKTIIFNQIPNDIKSRVFFLCGLNEAEDIKRDLGSGKIEDIGERLAESCHDHSYNGPETPWRCSQLAHNRAELKRLAEAVRHFIFLSAPSRGIFRA